MKAGTCLSWYSTWAEQDPASAAVVLPMREVSYSGLMERVASQSQALREAGLRPGQRIVVDAVGDEGRWIAALLAALAAGGQAVVPDSDWSVSRRLAALAVLTPAFLYDGDRLSPFPSAGRHDERASGAGIWLFTSGTTAKPEPHFRSLDMIRAMVERVKSRWPRLLAAGRPKILSTAPLTHGFGLVNALFLTHSMGGTLIVDRATDPAQTVARIAALQPEVLFAWPAHFKGMADAALWPEKSSLIWCVSSSFRLEPEIAQRFAACAGCYPRSQYGMTETGPLCLDGTIPPRSEPFCVGPTLPGIAIKVLDADGANVRPGAKGRLCVRVEDIALPAADGYWDTGDIGSIDDRGDVFVFGRFTSFTDERKELHA